MNRGAYCVNRKDEFSWNWILTNGKKIRTNTAKEQNRAKVINLHIILMLKSSPQPTWYLYNKVHVAVLLTRNNKIQCLMLWITNKIWFSRVLRYLEMNSIELRSCIRAAMYTSVEFCLFFITSNNTHHNVITSHLKWGKSLNCQ